MPQGITVRKPEFGSALGDFIIRDFREPLPRVEGRSADPPADLHPRAHPGRQVRDRPDQHHLHAIGAAGGSDEEHTLETEPITVEVAAAVAQEAPSLDQLRGPADPLPLPPSSSTARWWIAARGVPLPCLAAAAAWWLRRRRLPGPALLPTPAELANLELQRLRESDLAAHGRQAVLRRADGHRPPLHRADHGRFAPPSRRRRSFCRRSAAARTFPPSNRAG